MYGIKIDNVILLLGRVAVKYSENYFFLMLCKKSATLLLASVLEMSKIKVVTAEPKFP